MSYTTLSHIYSACWYDAAHNLVVYKNTRNLDLHWVVGASIIVVDRKKMRTMSCGISDETAGLLTGDELLRNSDNSHAWLEDKDGNVYDYYFPELDTAARSRYKDCPDLLLKPGVIEGVSRKTLAKLGYTLIPFTMKDQCLTALLRIQSVVTPSRIFDLENACRPLLERLEVMLQKEKEEEEEDDFPSILPPKQKQKRAESKGIVKNEISRF
jgi:hypothetical protein